MPQTSELEALFLVALRQIALLLLGRSAQPTPTLDFNAIGKSLLPATTQRLVELDECRELISLSLGQCQFSGESVGIVR